MSWATSLTQAHPKRLDRKFRVLPKLAIGALMRRHSGFVQAEIVAKNIQHLIDAEKLEEYRFDPAGIHLTLGTVSAERLWGNASC